MLIRPPWESQADGAQEDLSYIWNFCLSCHTDLPRRTGSTYDL